MQMSDYEIIRNYTEAKDKTKQIGILADLNGCNKEKIRTILISKGCQLPTKGRPKKEREIIKTDFDYDKAKKMVTIKNLSTGDTITKPLEELVVKKDNELTETPTLPTSVRMAIQDKIQALELEKMRITLEQEELEDYLEQFQDDV